MIRFRVVIPARFASTRLPGKPLVDLGGKPMIRRVVEQASASAAASVSVAIDDPRVGAAVEAAGAEVCMTRTDHVTGSDRIMEVVDTSGWNDDEIVVNVQGDEPLIPPAVIDQVAQLLADAADYGVATLSEPLESVADVFDASIVKVVSDVNGRALYFSRAPIPFARGNFEDRAAATLGDGWSRHVGIYAYRVAALRRFVNLAPGRLETTESLEQLRLLENGIDIRVARAVGAVPGGVDTPADVERVRRVIEAAF